MMIETFMVEANNSIGILLGEKNAPLPWRNHAPPDNPEVEELNAKFVEMDIDIQLPESSTKKIGQSDEAELADLLGNWAQSGNIKISGLEVKDEEDIADYLKNVLDPEARKNILEALSSAQEKATSLKESTRRIVDHGLFYLLQRAFYSSNNSGHFGLSGYYAERAADVTTVMVDGNILMEDRQLQTLELSSIMPAPVCLRSLFTSAAVMLIIYKI